MDWLSQNWIWLPLVAGGAFLMMRIGGSCCGMGQSMSQSQGNGNSAGGAGPGAGPTTTFDPVSGHPLPAGGTISTVYQGRAYYFESRENRDTFESDPAKYLAGSSAVGETIGSKGASMAQAQRRHGCC